MRFHQMLHAALASVFVVPAVTLTSGEAQGLEQALAETVRAIESLSGLRTELEVKDTDTATIESAVSRVLTMTEAPKLVGPEGDDFLATLRRDVSRLQMVLDGLTAPAGTQARSAMGPHTAPDRSPDAEAEPPITTGLDEEARAVLMNIQPPVAEMAQHAGVRATVSKPVDGVPFTAEPLRLGHAYYRAGRYAEGLIILSKRPDDVEARYWSARCLEHLARYEEAVEAYSEVVANPSAGYLADRAKSDLSFLSWKLEFSKRIDREGGNR